LPAPIVNGEEIAFENGWISNFEGLVTLTLDQVILHTALHHSSTSTYVPNFIEIKETFCGWKDVCTYVPSHGRMPDRLTFETGFIRPTLLRSRPKNLLQLKSEHWKSMTMTKTLSYPKAGCCQAGSTEPKDDAAVGLLKLTHKIAIPVNLAQLTCNSFYFYVIITGFWLSQSETVQKRFKT